MTRISNQRKTNGHAGPQDRPNGHAPASAERGGDSSPGHRGGRHHGLAASDDASGVPVANAAALVAAAGTARDKACADVAPPRPNGARRTSAREKPARSEEQDAIPPGKEPLPDHPSEFAEEIHRRIDLIEVWVSLLRSKDEKIKQRAAERLTDLHYKLGAAMEDELQPIVIDIDSAVARRAAEGAKE